jgi:hypothetical protein
MGAQKSLLTKLGIRDISSLTDDELRMTIYADQNRRNKLQDSKKKSTTVKVKSAKNNTRKAKSKVQKMSDDV